MALLSSSTLNHARISVSLYGLLLLLFLASRIRCYGLRTFAYDVHHRFSDPVKGVLGIDDVDLLPAKGSREYYVAMSHRDRAIRRGRNLAAGVDRTALTFAGGNDTYRIASLGL